MKEGRLAERRANYIEGTTELSYIEGLVLVYFELGYTSSGVGKCIDRNESTVKGYMGRIIARFGPSTIHTRGDIEIEDPVNPITLEWFNNKPKHITRAWEKYAEREPDYVPEKVREILL